MSTRMLGKGVVLVFCLLVLGLTLFSSVLLPFIPQTIADLTNNSNTTASVITRVNISNSPPYVFNVTVTNPINLAPNSSANVSCNVSVLDYNNWSDIAYVNVSFFSTNISLNGDPDTNRSHYSVWNCTDSAEISIFERRYHCMMNVSYNAFFSNWTCNATAADIAGTKDTQFTTTIINDLISFFVPDELDFGDVPVTNTSLNKHLNTTNFGNQPLNFTVFAYAREENDSAVMLCEFGNITLGSLRFSTNISDLESPINFNEMIEVNNSNATANSLGVIAHPFNETLSNPINGSTWRLFVPLGPAGTPAGLCNGTLILRGEKAFNSVS